MFYGQIADFISILRKRTLDVIEKTSVNSKYIYISAKNENRWQNDVVN